MVSTQSVLRFPTVYRQLAMPNTREVDGRLEVGLCGNRHAVRLRHEYESLAVYAEGSNHFGVKGAVRNLQEDFSGEVDEADLVFADNM